jgi:hypothetical protein
MNHTFQLSDEQYAKLAAYADQQNQTPETLFQSWVNEITHNSNKNMPRNHTEPPIQKLQSERGDETLNSPLLKVAGMFAIGEPGWADRHDEYLAEGYLEDHADN